ncbi:WbqC family protein [Streptomyces sp. NPDC021096]|uniref:WbqC family protein n=1 Tax=Streptomyces sp. NPDC021096 TaxID=3154792 RepID=UPI0033FE7ED6
MCMPRTNPSSATASTAASSPPEPPPGGLCAIHQPNFFPRLSTLAKLFAADYWIVLDDVQFTRRDYQHRARLAALNDPADRRWLSIPTHLPHGRQTLIRDAVMAEPAQSQRRTARVLRQHYGTSPHWSALQQALVPVLDSFTNSSRTAAIAEASTQALLGLLGWKGRTLHSSGLPARPQRSQRLADLTATVGARGYLCGSGGMTYLDHSAFTGQEIEVIRFRPPQAGAWGFSRELSALWSLMRMGLPAVANALQHMSAELDGHLAEQGSAPGLGCRHA